MRSKTCPSVAILHQHAWDILSGVQTAELDFDLDFLDIKTRLVWATCQIYGTLVLGFAEGKESYTCLLYEVRIDELGSQLWKHQGAGATGAGFAALLHWDLPSAEMNCFAFGAVQ